MKILSVELTNFGTFYGTHKFGLADRGLLLVLGDNQDDPRANSNGAGKSHIFDALDWCLWGDNPRGDHADALCNEEAFIVRGSKCSVAVFLENDNGDEVIIRRHRSKSKLELNLSAGGKDLTALDTKETQKAVTRLLGLNREVFHAAVLFGQTDLVHYADATDAMRMEILTRLLQLGEIDVYLIRAKQRLKNQEDRVSYCQVQLAGVVGQLEVIRPGEFDAQIGQWQRDYAAGVAILQDQIDTQAASYQVAKAELPDSESLLILKAQAEVALGALGGTPGESLENSQARQAVEGLQTEVAVGAQACVTLENQLIKMQTMGEGVCSECGQPVTAEHLLNEVQKAQKALQAAADRQSLTRGRVDSAKARSTAAIERGNAISTQWLANREKYLKEIGDIAANLQVASAHAARLVDMERNIQRFQTDLAGRKDAVNPFLEQKSQAEKKRYDLERRQGQIKYELEASEVEVRYLEFWVHGLGPKGLKSYILDSRLQELSDAANEWLGLLTGGTTWVRFEAQRQTRGKKLINAPDVRVFRWNPDGTIIERSYRSWSGGEKQRISFAIDFGLSRLVARRATQRYDLLILDEAFRHLDRAGKEAVTEMLQKLAYEKSSLIVVEHDSEFQGQFDRRVVVTKRNRRSSIKELDHAEKCETEKGVSSDLSVNPHRERPRRTPIRRPAT